MIFNLLIRNRKMNLDKNLRKKKKYQSLLLNIFHCLRREALLIVTIKWYKIEIIKSSV